MAGKYGRLSSVGYLLVARVKGGQRDRGKKKDDSTDDDQDEKREDQRVVPYENKLFIIVIMIFSFVEFLKTGYFFYMPVTLNDRLLYGNLIISFQEDQRLMDFIMMVCCLAGFVYCNFLLFGQQKTYFHRLGKFLLVLNTKEYSRKFLVSKRFAEQFDKLINRGVLINQLVFCNYVFFDLSFYSRGIYKSIWSGFSLQQILLYTSPSILVGFFAHVVFYRLAVQAYVFFILYVRLMNARWDRLARNLDKCVDKLDDGPNGRRRLARHFTELDSVVSEYKVSRNFFEISLMLTVPPVLSTIALFPSIIMFSPASVLTNQIFPMFFFNLFAVFVPIVKANEKFKRAFSLYLNSVHRFMTKSRNLRTKLKLMKILDISQTNFSVSYTLLGGLFDLEMKTVPIILAESFTLTILIYSFNFYAQR